VIGLGVELDVVGDGPRFRAQFGVGDRPYLLYIGRLDPGKGSDELYDYFTTLKARRASDLALVVVGEPVKPFDPHPDVFTTGFVPEAVKVDAIDGCTALVMPSYFESFSLVLAEAWALSRPALVQGHCDVLVGQAQRSEGAIPYEGFAQFEAAVDLLRETPSLRADLGFRGRRYVTERYRWDTVLDRYEQLYALATTMFRQTSPPIARATLSR
jgi:glycosyltransferase involved in cell wall biosynthesis